MWVQGEGDRLHLLRESSNIPEEQGGADIITRPLERNLQIASHNSVQYATTYNITSRKNIPA